MINRGISLNLQLPFLFRNSPYNLGWKGIIGGRGYVASRDQSLIQARVQEQTQSHRPGAGAGYEWTPATVRGFRVGSPYGQWIPERAHHPPKPGGTFHGSTPHVRECVLGNDEPVRFALQRLPRHPDGANDLEEKQVPLGS